MDQMKEIREFLELFLADRPESYLDHKIRSTKYTHLNSQKLI